MFDVGFWELVLVALVTLIVVGPERLPQLARTAGLWMGRLRRMADGVREEIQRELAAEELKKNLKNLEQESGLEELNQAMRDTEGELREAAGTADTEQRYEILEEEPAEPSSTEPPAADAPTAEHRPDAAPAADPAPAAEPPPEPAAPSTSAPEPHRDGTHDGKS